MKTSTALNKRNEGIVHSYQGKARLSFAVPAWRKPSELKRNSPSGPSTTASQPSQPATKFSDFMLHKQVQMTGLSNEACAGSEQFRNVRQLPESGLCP